MAKNNIPFDQNVDMTSGGGLRANLSWGNLTPYLQSAFGVKPTEKIVGITVDDFGVEVIIEKIRPRHIIIQ